MKSELLFAIFRGFWYTEMDNSRMEENGMKEFTQKHQRVLDYIRRCVDDGVPPTVREICDSLGIKSTSTGHKYLRELEEMGYITMGGNRNRCIRLVGRQEEKAVQVPLLGTVAAGMPILAVESLEGYVPFAAGRYDPSELFALRVKGESMIEAGILDGDIIIARRTPVAENGQIVVAIVGDEATVKTFYKEKGHFRLQPENSTMETIIVTETAILGKVISVVRNYE